MKKCSICCEEKDPKKHFSRRAASKDGYHSRCKKCDSERHAHPDPFSVKRQPTVSAKLHNVVKQNNVDLRHKVKAHQRRISELKDEVLELQRKLLKEHK